MDLKKMALAAGIVVVAGGAWYMAQSSGGQGAPESVSLGAVMAESFEGYVLGSDTAPVEIVEYADFQCPACARLAVLTLPDVKQRLVASGRVRWVFRDFPLDIHDKARLAHHAAACAGEQNRFWEMHDQIFYGQNDWSPMSERRARRTFEDYAEAVGINADQWDDCMDSGRYAARIEASIQEGVQLGVRSTPSFVVGNSLFSGVFSYDAFKALVDSLAPLPSE